MTEAVIVSACRTAIGKFAGTLATTSAAHLGAVVIKEAVRRANAQWIAPTDDERLTLVTCWPYISNTHRLIIVAKPVSNDQ